MYGLVLGHCINKFVSSREAAELTPRLLRLASNYWVVTSSRRGKNP